MLYELYNGPGFSCPMGCTMYPCPMHHPLYNILMAHAPSIVQCIHGPWVIGCTIYSYPMSHPLYNMPMVHGPSIVQYIQGPWFIGCTIHPGHVTWGWWLIRLDSRLDSMMGLMDYVSRSCDFPKKAIFWWKFFWSGKTFFLKKKIPF